MTKKRIHNFKININKELTAKQLERATEILNDYIENNDKHTYVGDLNDPKDRKILFDKIKLDIIMEGFKVAAGINHDTGIATMRINIFK